MKFKLLASAVIAGIGVMGTAQAVNLNPDGTGEVLIYPYYSVNGDYTTNISVVNTTGEAKAVKVRFLDAGNSQEVRDFNLYLSEYDVWTAAIAPDGDNARMTTSDTSCTAPRIPDNGIDFTDSEFADEPNSMARVREGYVEIIEMGTITPGSQLETAVTHNSDGVPNDCSYVLDNSGRGDTNGLNTLKGQMTTPSGGLYGYGTLVNGVDGFAASYDAIAIDAFVSDGDILAEPGDVNPSLADADPVANVIDGVDVYEVGFLGGGIDAVSAVLMKSKIMNDYVVDPGLNAMTDWVVTFPTKRSYVNGSTPFSPFTSTWDDSKACEAVNITLYDREEQTVGGSGPVFSPAPPQGVDSICYEANVISFNGESLLDSFQVNDNNVDTPFDAGWMSIDFTRAGRQLTGADLAGDPVTFHGLPAVGFAVTSFVNGDVGGLLANYAGAVEHKAEKVID